MNKLTNLLTENGFLLKKQEKLPEIPLKEEEEEDLQIKTTKGLKVLFVKSRNFFLLKKI